MSLRPFAFQEECELMARFGIKKVPAHRYHYRDWRYSNLEDALAHARRDFAVSQAKTKGKSHG